MCLAVYILIRINVSVLLILASWTALYKHKWLVICEVCDFVLIINCFIFYEYIILGFVCV